MCIILRLGHAVRRGKIFSQITYFCEKVENFPGKRKKAVKV
jgi:hypothetical protein